MNKSSNKDDNMTPDNNNGKPTSNSDAVESRPKPFPTKDLNTLIGLKDTILRPEIPGKGPRTDSSTTVDSDADCLTVGRNICLTGKITACQKLIVNGHVEATLRDAHTIEVSPGGYFKGDAEVINAIVGGNFEGKISVTNVLTIQKNGVINGSVTYGKIIIEEGGQILGDMTALNHNDNTN
jgi:cytoskeletal protein CcmA (bactofilin family)